MDRKVRVRKREKPPLTEIYYNPPEDGKYEGLEPDAQMMRIWMGVVPPEDVKLPNGETEICPGYACVIGEAYDGNPAQVDRRRMVLDEGIALDPGDFTEEERAYYQIPEVMPDAPTLYDLRRAIVALKDIYWVDIVLTPPGNVRFHRYVLATEGLISYDPRIPDRIYRKLSPFYDGRYRVGHGIIQVEEEQREYNVRMVDSMLAKGIGGQPQLEIQSDCTIFWNRRPKTAYRAIGLVLSEMQLRDMTYEMRTFHFSDGYAEDDEQDEARSAASERLMDQCETLAWWGGQSLQRRPE